MDSSAIETEKPLVPCEPVPPFTIQPKDSMLVNLVSDLFNSKSCDLSWDAPPFLDLHSPENPIASEMIRTGHPMGGLLTTTVGPVSADTARRGKLLLKLLTEGGDLNEVIPEVEVVST